MDFWYHECMRYLKTNTTYCFSPPVMLATMAIEFGLAAYTMWRYKFTEIAKVAVGLLVLLAVFQLAEYNVCEGSFGIDSLSWSRLGYMSISFLPALGLHLAIRLAGKKGSRAINAGYAMATGFAAFFGLTPIGITAPACLGNYVIFKQAPGSEIYYTLYYYGWMLVGTIYAFRAAARVKSAARAKALYALTAGYLALFIPTTTVNLIDPMTRAGIPSIMCGFAVILALLVGFIVVPNGVEAKDERRAHAKSA